MKHLLIAAITLLLMGSCTKKQDYNIIQLQVSFDVEEQNNVANYIVQASGDGKEYTDKAIIKADNSSMSRSYNIYVSGQYTKTVYVRIKSVDNDGSFDYSPITWVKL